MPVQPFSLRLAASALLLGGLVVGGAPVPLAEFGCQPALSTQPLSENGSDVTVVLACAQSRADRQLLAAGLLVSGVALLALTVPGRRDDTADTRRSVLTADRP